MGTEISSVMCKKAKKASTFVMFASNLSSVLLLEVGGKLPSSLALAPALTLGIGPQFMATNPYLPGMPQVGSTFNHFFTPGPMMHTIVGPDPAVGSPLGVVPQTIVPQKLPRSDRLEVCREFVRGACKRPEGECRFAHPPAAVTANEDGTVTVCMDAVKGRCTRDPCRYFHPPLHLQAHIKVAQSRVTAVGIHLSIAY
ncbi:hypothetical protein RUM43_008639 [Polyplax serrata]|uniref:C3H1-type domain-containing protein n=1 Tax=Polyplax serrata TaxID=468196 RepID=A0AAN8NNP9_POLSC